MTTINPSLIKKIMIIHGLGFNVLSLGIFTGYKMIFLFNIFGSIASGLLMCVLMQENIDQTTWVKCII